MLIDDRMSIMRDKSVRLDAEVDEKRVIFLFSIPVLFFGGDVVRSFHHCLFQGIHVGHT
jgi:hypothetical protein